jgi:hypothetical protein
MLGENRVEIETGRIIELYEPPESGQGPMRAGTCPGCRERLNGYVGRCAAVRVLNAQGRPIVSKTATNYGHYECIKEGFDRLRDAYSDFRQTAHDQRSPANRWRTGTQRQLLDHIQESGVVGQVEFNADAPRDRRYRWRVI